MRLYPLHGQSLTFTFEDWPTQRDVDSLQTWFARALPDLEARMGAPAFPNLVTIRYDPQLGYAGLYNSTTNEIILKYLPSSTQSTSVLAALIHETYHAWRDDYCIWGMCHEEGLARMR